MQYRCKGKVHGELSEDGLLVFMCSHIACTGGKKRSFVLHYMDPNTGTIKYTSRPYRNPLKGKENGN
ncbi:gp24 [Mycobacterium phage PLot]|uniref:Uncharacterized protein n=17 Tax=Plotvirus plot TaxID=2170099 RepID=Q19YC5_9CAUD|nr:gp23 [Mycobacterium phage Troll4]YP_002241917.1 gp22 [Mycobacterium phage Gumball]YP_655403.1 gp24 [Mycobacterium phage PLot]ACD49609.1 hypothetical protein Adjutor_24 [Mycobacterium phage Adjutor]ACI06311.1 hypothetical protein BUTTERSCOTCH_23 [Mycobacterium phage Butterscotch]AEK10232.1 hypothetical protein PBI_SIRHARLEY_22 [Mycobacterium phage SirHarley]AER49776.1 hypothetical protein NOVA_23 [Mycobacterium phage Nova]AVP43120.1 hypothetical protein PBI_BIGMAMA_21 [Mycobacterium phage 